LLEKILGPKQNAVIVAIDRASDVGTERASILLKILTPFVLSVLGNRKNERNLDIEAFQGLLLGQSEPVAAALTTEVSAALEFSAFMNVLSEPSAADVALS